MDSDAPRIVRGDEQSDRRSALQDDAGAFYRFGVAMMTEPVAPIVMTHLDAERLGSLLDSRVGVAYRIEAQRLRRELRRATVIPAQKTPANLVTMNSTVVFLLDEERAPTSVTLVYPWRARERGTLNILSPLGTCLLGLRVDQSRRVEGGRHQGRLVTVVAVSNQPESVGNWHL